MSNDQIKLWLDANVWDGEDRSGSKDSVTFSPDSLLELVTDLFQSVEISGGGEEQKPVKFTWNKNGRLINMYDSAAEAEEDMHGFNDGYAMPLYANLQPSPNKADVPIEVSDAMFFQMAKVSIRYGYDDMDEPVTTSVSHSEAQRLWSAALSALPPLKDE